MPIWTDSQLNQWQTDAIQQINQDLPCIWERSYLSTVRGNPIYRLPSQVRTLSRVQWRGRKLDSVNWNDITTINPASAYLAPNANIDMSVGRPMFYAQHPSNPYEIRLHPTPNESLSIGTDPYKVTLNEPYCTLSYWRSAEVGMLPPYIERRTIKAYVMWRAFAAEGPGQNTQFAKYFKGKYYFLIAQFTAINSSVFVSKRYALGDNVPKSFRYPKPTLGPRFERTIY